MNILHTITRFPLRAAIVGAFCVSAPLAMAVSPAVAQTAAAPEASAQLDNAVAALRGISTMQADFTQSDRNGQVIRGKLTLKSPGRIRFEYEKAANMLVVSDGKALTLVDYDVAQVQRWPISNSPLGALLDPHRDVKRFGRLIPTGNPAVTSIEVKDPKRPEYGTITLIFVKNGAAPGGLELASWVALDAQKNRTTVRLSGQRYGGAVADSAFTFRDPRITTRRPR
jgi:outer membrane lipoprotein-sorting protein